MPANRGRIKRMRIVLAGNPNSGKTTLFNSLTGANQRVGNWPGVTVEQKTGRLRTNKEILIIDLPGIYSLSPYTTEEEVARNYLLREKPEVIINIVDGTNLERNLYLTTQLLDLNIPVVLAINMADVLKKNGDLIHLEKLETALGIPVVTISALTGENVFELAEVAMQLAQTGSEPPATKPFKTLSSETEDKTEEKTNSVATLALDKTPGCLSDTTFLCFPPAIEKALAKIGDLALKDIDPKLKRWYQIKLFERDNSATKVLQLTEPIMSEVENVISSLEESLDDDSESIITSERYQAISNLLRDSYQRKDQQHMSFSDKVDQIVTNRYLALPIFILVMFLVYFISVSTIGSLGTDFANEGLFGEGWFFLGRGRAAYEAALQNSVSADLNPASFGPFIPGIPSIIENALLRLNVTNWLYDLIMYGIVSGVGAVLGFVPQMFILFFCLAILESVGYMARIAFIMDRIFRRFGLSGKSFIPLMIGTGCSVPGIMAARTIENERDRRMTIITTSFIPCSAKLPVIALIAGAFFGNSGLITTACYFIGIAAVILSGIMLKKTRPFRGPIAPFVIELPAYHLPRFRDIFKSAFDRSWSFIKRAGSVILLTSIVIWFLTAFSFENGFRQVSQIEHSLLADIGNVIGNLFRPLGFGNWQTVVATISGLIAKENIVSTFGVIYGMADLSVNGHEIWTSIASQMSALAAFSFLLFNLLCAPCFAAVGAIRKEMSDRRWTWFAIFYQTIFAYTISFIVYQLGSFIGGAQNIIGLIFAISLIIGYCVLLFRPMPEQKIATNAAISWEES